jgi:adenosine deaminase
MARDVHGLGDEHLARLARGSIRGARAPRELQRAALADIDAWLLDDADPSG